MVTFVPREASPDRLDALVWAITALVGKRDSSVIFVLPRSPTLRPGIPLDERIPWPDTNDTAAIGDGLLNSSQK